MRDPKNPPRGWHRRGYLPHFDGGEIPQFITFRLGDSVPQELLRKWREELRDENCDVDTALRKRIEMFLDQGYGECWLRSPAVARKVQDSFLFFRWRTLSTNGLGCHAKSCTPAFNSCGRTRTIANSSLAEVVHCKRSQQDLASQRRVLAAGVIRSAHTGREPLREHNLLHRKRSY